MRLIKILQKLKPNDVILIPMCMYIPIVTQYFPIQPESSACGPSSFAPLLYINMYAVSL